MIRLLVALYPRKWRATYGEEFAAFLADTRLTPRAVFDVVVSAGKLHAARLTANIAWAPSTPARERGRWDLLAHYLDGTVGCYAADLLERRPGSGRQAIAVKTMRVVTTFIGAAACAVGFTVAAPVAAHAGTGSPVELWNYFNEECLTDVGMSPGAAASMETCSPGSSRQTWQAVVYSGYIEIQATSFPRYCLDGRLGKGKVAVDLCGSDGTHQHWIEIIPCSSCYFSYVFKDQFNGECLDGRLGAGNVTLQTCGTDGNHEVWQAVQVSTST
jgi:hypothetical protein